MAATFDVTGGTGVSPVCSSQDRRDAGWLFGWSAILQSRPGGAFGSGRFEREEQVVALIGRQLQIRQSSQEHPIPAFEQGGAFLGRQLFTQEAQLRGELSPFLDACLGRGAVPQKLTDAAQERLVLFGVRAVPEARTPAGSLSHIAGILAQAQCGLVSWSVVLPRRAGSEIANDAAQR